MNLGEDLQKDLLKASQADFKTLVKTVIYWVDEAYKEGWDDGYDIRLDEECNKADFPLP